jgi:hypothetical protein
VCILTSSFSFFNISETKSVLYSYRHFYNRIFCILNSQN